MALPSDGDRGGIGVHEQSRYRVPFVGGRDGKLVKLDLAIAGREDRADFRVVKQLFDPLGTPRRRTDRLETETFVQGHPLRVIVSNDDILETVILPGDVGGHQVVSIGIGDCG